MPSSSRQTGMMVPGLLGAGKRGGWVGGSGRGTGWGERV